MLLSKLIARNVIVVQLFVLLDILIEEKYIPLQKMGKMVRNVDFNLSVVVSGKNEANAGLKISIARVGIGNETTNSTTSTISFSIPVAFPLEK